MGNVNPYQPNKTQVFDRLATVENPISKNTLISNSSPELHDLLDQLETYGVKVRMCDVIFHTSIFYLRSYCHTSCDPEYSLSFQEKFWQRGILKYLIFCSLSGPLFLYFIISLFYLFYFYFY